MAAASSAAAAMLSWLRYRVDAYVIVPLLLLLAAHIWLRTDLWLPLSRLPRDTYLAPVMLLEAVQHARVLVPLLVCFALAAIWRRLRWSDLESGVGVRLVVAATSFVFVCYISLAPYNLWADQLHALDRLVLPVLLVGVWLRPGLTPSLLCCTMILLGEKAGGVSALSWTDKRLAIDALMLFCVWLVLHRSLRVSVTSLLLAWLVLTGACYLRAAQAKFHIGDGVLDWALHGDLANLFIAAYVNGWWKSFDEQTVLDVASALSAASAVLGVCTVLLELSGVLLGFRRRTSAILLLAFAGMHIGILVASGIFFWKWMVFELALAAYLWREAAEPWRRVRAWHGVVVAVAVATSSWTLKPPALGWWDTRFSQTLDLVVVGESGARYEVDRDLLAPHDIPFKQGRFFSLYDVPAGVTTYGATYSRKLFALYQEAESPKAVLAIARKQRPERARPSAVRRIDEHVSRVFRAANQHGGRPWSWLPAPPAHIFSAPMRGLPVYAGQERVVQAEWSLRETVYDGAAIHVVGDRVIHTAKIAP